MKVNLSRNIEAFLESLAPKELAKTLHTIELLEEFGHQLGMPHSKHLTGGLLELRVRGTREIRIFYCFHDNTAALLHGFIKKTQKTPTKEINQARLQRDQLH